MGSPVAICVWTGGIVVGLVGEWGRTRYTFVSRDALVTPAGPTRDLQEPALRVVALRAIRELRDLVQGLATAALQREVNCVLHAALQLVQSHAPVRPHAAVLRTAADRPVLQSGGGGDLMADVRGLQGLVQLLYLCPVMLPVKDKVRDFASGWVRGAHDHAVRDGPPDVSAQGVVRRHVVQLLCRVVAKVIDVPVGHQPQHQKKDCLQSSH